MSRTRFLILALIGVLLPIATPQVRLNIVSAWERPEVQQQLDRWLLRGASGTAELIKYVEAVRKGLIKPSVVTVGGQTVGVGEVDTSADFALTHGQTFAEPGEIEAVLKGWNSPAAGSGAEILAAARQYKIDAAYGLAMCEHESGCGTAGPGWAGYISPTESSNNPGNIICTPGSNEWWDGSCLGRFRRYSSWGKGFGDLFKLLAYYRDELGDKTIENALYRWAPPSDGNNQNDDCQADPSSYPCSVKARVSGWRNVQAPVERGTQAVVEASGTVVEPWPGFFGSECAGLHDGARDYCHPEGTPVLAPLDGKFLQTGRYEDELKYGDYLMFLDDAGREWYFGHMKDVNPKGWQAGDRILAGEQMGVLGPFPHSTPHTHNQLRVNGALTDPGPVYAELRKQAPPAAEAIDIGAVIRRVAGSAADPQAEVRQKVVELALSRQGDPYVRGGRVAGGSDCSGFVQYVYKTVTGIDPGATTFSQYPNLKPVELADLKEGDLWYGQYTADQHTGIVADVDHDGKWDIIHNGLTKDAVHIDHDFLANPTFANYTMGFRTVLSQ